MMSAEELALNRKDLNAYISGDYKVNSMLPGQPSPHVKSDKKYLSQMSAKEDGNQAGSRSLLSLDFLEKQKRL
tara:strand:+ start:241 stop:459 length:219 start_codon:yes stop_codon:yes gene_type:complete